MLFGITGGANASVSDRSSISTVHDLDLPARADLFSMLDDLSHVAGLDPCNLHDLARVSWAGSVTMQQMLGNLSRRQLGK